MKAACVLFTLVTLFAATARATVQDSSNVAQSNPAPDASSCVQECNSRHSIGNIENDSHGAPFLGRLSGLDDETRVKCITLCNSNFAKVSLIALA
jgi:hypothetical protein